MAQPGRPDSHSRGDLGRVDVEETKLPGIGLRHEFLTVRERRIGVLTHRMGRRDVFLYSEDDPDAVESMVILTDDEADTLSGLLGGARFAEHLDRALGEVPGVAIERLPLPVDSRYAGHVLGDTHARTETGVSIVALLRAGDVLPAPGPATCLLGGDTLVVVGTPEGIAALSALLAR